MGRGPEPPEPGDEEALADGAGDRRHRVRHGDPGARHPLLELGGAGHLRLAPVDLDALDQEPAVARLEYRYGDPAGIDAGVQAGLLTRDAGLRATDRGHAFLTELRSLHSRVLAEHWSGEDERIDRLLEVFDRLLHAGLESGGPAFATMAAPSVAGRPC